MLTRLLVSVAALASYAAAQSSSSGSIMPNATISSSGSFFPNVTASSTGNIIPNATVSSTGIFPNVTASSTGMMNMTSSTGVMPPMNMTSSTGVMPPMSSTGPSGMTSCMGAGYDLSSIANMDLTLDDGDYIWAVRPCGTVSADLDLCDGQMCQDDTVISRYEPALVNWYAIDGGVNLEVQNGDDSGCNGPRESDINFICNATSLTPRLVSVEEDTSCHYRAIIHTAAACTRNTSYLPGVGDAFTSPVCGGNAYDLSSLNSQDITGDFGGWNWTVRVCGPVSEPNCASAQPLSVCQHAGDEVWKLANYGASLPLYEINPNGLNMSLESGEPCGDNGNRTTLITFDCDPLATTPVMTEASEYYMCEYWFRIRTSAVCGAPFQARPQSSSSGAPVPTSSSTGLPMQSSSAAPTTPPVFPSSSSASFPTDSSSSVPVFPTDSSSSEPTIPDFSSSDIFEPFSSTGEDLENPGLNGAASVSISGVVLFVSMMAALAL